MKKPLYVLVVGGSVLTNRNSNNSSLNLKNVKIIVNEIKKAKKKKKFSLVIVHGMGSYGHPIAKKFDINLPLRHSRKIKGRSLLTHSLGVLNKKFVALLIKNGLRAINYESTPTITDKGKIVKMSISTLKKFIHRGYIPVLQAFPVFDKSYGVCILSSDHLGPYIASSLQSNLLIGGTSVNGVYDRNPSEPNARLIKKITRKNFKNVVRGIVSSGYIDVTGGMLRKISEYLDAADKNVKGRIINLAQPDSLSNAILGKPIGTLISKN